MDALNDARRTLKFIFSAVKQDVKKTDKHRIEWSLYFLLYTLLGMTGIHYLIGQTYGEGLKRMGAFAVVLGSYFFINNGLIIELLTAGLGLIYIYDLYLFIWKDGWHIIALSINKKPDWWIKVFFIGVWFFYLQIMLTYYDLVPFLAERFG